MPRTARIVVPGLPHHITQRGNRRQLTFFCDDDYRRYLGLLQGACRKHGVAVWAYCLMPNHVHLIVVPPAPDSLAELLGAVHVRYTRAINTRFEWRGHLWQGRFASFPMDERHLFWAARYVERNPLRAGLAPRPEAWPWSSARAHLAARDDGVCSVAPLLERVRDWRGYLETAPPGAQAELIRRHARSGRPLGSSAFVARLGRELGRSLAPAQTGRPPREHDDDREDRSAF